MLLTPFIFQLTLVNSTPGPARKQCNKLFYVYITSSSGVLGVVINFHSTLGTNLELKLLYFLQEFHQFGGQIYLLLYIMQDFRQIGPLRPLIVAFRAGFPEYR